MRINDDQFVPHLLNVLEPVLSHAHLLIQATIDSPEVDSPATRLCLDERRFSLGMLQPLPITEALRNVNLYMRAGNEHLGAVASVLRGGVDIGTSLASLVRGATEAYGRAYFFISEPTVHSLLAGFLRVQLSSENYLQQQMKHDAMWMQKSKARERALRATAKLLVFEDQEIAFIKPSAHAVALVNALTPAGGPSFGQYYYSMLSAKAHHELSGSASQRIDIVRSDAGMPYTLVFGLHPRALAKLLGLIAVAHVHVMKQYLRVHAVDPTRYKEWENSANELGWLLQDFLEAPPTILESNKLPEGIEFPSDLARLLSVDDIWGTG